MSKTIGIIGGMGPLATIDLFKKIVLLTEAQRDQDHIHILVDNDPGIPDRTNYILHGGESPESHLIRSALKLEMMGADVLLMACNTAHYFYDSINKMVKVKFLSMIEETALQIKLDDPSCARVGLLATEGTVKAGIYERVLKQHQIEVVKPDDEQQKIVTRLIYSLKAGEKLADLKPLYGMLSDLKQKQISRFILGCTELPVAFEMYGIQENTIDPTDILARSAIRYVGKNIHQPE